MARSSSTTITLRDVADVASVSASAGSVALRKRPRIGEDTKARVRAAADELGDAPDSAGREGPARPS